MINQGLWAIAADAAPRHPSKTEPRFTVSALRVGVAYRGPSERFIRRRLNPDLLPHTPVRFEPTPKAEGDIVL